MQRLPSRWWPLLALALVAACTDDTASPGNGTGGTGGTSPQDSGVDVGSPVGDASADVVGKPDVLQPPPPGDGGLAPCLLDLPTDLDRPPSGRLPCDLLPPGFVAP